MICFILNVCKLRVENCGFFFVFRVFDYICLLFSKIFGIDVYWIGIFRDCIFKSCELVFSVKDVN